MKAYILVDEQKIIRCMATEECNLHKDKLHMKKYYAEMRGWVGDEYDEKTDTWISHPENYPKPPKSRIKIQLIGIQRELQSLETLEAEGIDVKAELKQLKDKKAKLKREFLSV